MVITVECPSCASSFPVDPAKIPEGGVNARCTTCREVFRVERPPEPDEAPGAEATEEAAPDPGEGGVGTADPADHDAEEDEEAEVEHDDGEEADAGDDDGFTATEEGGGEGDGDLGGPEPEESEEPAPGSSADELEVDAGDPEDWVFETEGDFETEAVASEPAETLDADPTFATHDEASTEDDALPSFDMGGAPLEVEHPEAGSGADGEPSQDELPGAGPEEAGSKPVQGFSFGKRDPADKARRLARVLVSDMIMYNPERHERALSNGTLADDFEEEIAKSWKEYVEQVGREMAEGTDYWTEALNDLLAKGEDVF